MSDATTQDSNDVIDFKERNNLTLHLRMDGGNPSLKIYKRGALLPVTSVTELLDKFREQTAAESVVVKLKPTSDWSNVQVQSTDGAVTWKNLRHKFKMKEGKNAPKVEFTVTGTAHADSEPSTAPGGWICTHWDATTQEATWELDPIVKIKRRSFTGG